MFVFHFIKTEVKDIARYLNRGLESELLVYEERIPFISLATNIVEFLLIHVTKKVTVYGFNDNIAKRFLYDINSRL